MIVVGEPWVWVIQAGVLTTLAGLWGSLCWAVLFFLRRSQGVRLSETSIRRARR